MYESEFRYAIISRSLEKVKLLYYNNTQFDYIDNVFSGDTPLLCAIKYSNISIVKFIISCGANINCMDRDRNTPILTAISNYNIDVITLILENNPNIFTTNRDGISPLSLACDIKSYTLIETLLKIYKFNNKTVNVSILINNIYNNNKLVVDLLLKSGISIYSEDRHGVTPYSLSLKHSIDTDMRNIITSYRDIKGISDDYEIVLLEYDDLWEI